MGILNDIKKLLGIVPENTAFDEILVMHINSVFMTLDQLLDGEKFTKHFFINGEEEDWDEVADTSLFQSLKQYIYTKVVLVFDPPQTSYILQSLKETSQELEWRLMAQCVDYKREGGG